MKIRVVALILFLPLAVRYNLHRSDIKKVLLQNQKFQDYFVDIQYNYGNITVVYWLEEISQSVHWD